MHKSYRARATSRRRRRSQCEKIDAYIIYTFFIYVKFQAENVYSILHVFYSVEAVFLLKSAPLDNGEFFVPPKWRRDRPAGSSNLLAAVTRLLIM